MSRFRLILISNNDTVCMPICIFFGFIIGYSKLILFYLGTKKKILSLVDQSLSNTRQPLEGHLGVVCIPACYDPFVLHFRMLSYPLL